MAAEDESSDLLLQVDYTAELLTTARDKVTFAVNSTSTPKAAVYALGGPEQACTHLSLASLDVDADGKLGADEYERYKNIGEKIIENAKNFYLNAGVVSALVLSVVFGLAYEENETLEQLVAEAAAESSSGYDASTNWDTARMADLTSFIGMQCAVATSFLTVLMSSRLYTQLAFWMPTIDAQLWFIHESAAIMHYLELSKNFTLVATLLALTLETAVTATWYDALACIPLAVIITSYIFMEWSLSSKCCERLGVELQRVVANHPNKPRPTMHAGGSGVLSAGPAASSVYA